LEQIFTSKVNDRFVETKLFDNDLISPYLSGVILKGTEKIYWESKRGCPYTCGFCEWGNAANRKVYEIDSRRVKKEIALFKTYNLKEINVIDATFLIRERDYEILQELLTIPYCNITMQVRFENLDSNIGDKFLKLCHENRDRIKLEFGLQTIHESEMKALNRMNDLDKIQKIITKLNLNRINYLISIIFGIPGQTTDSFDKTIEFIKKNGCEQFVAFPLQIPKNSELSRMKSKYQIEECQGSSFSLSFVDQSYSFSRADWEDMCSKAGQPFIGDPCERHKPYYDMNHNLPGMFSVLKKTGYKYAFVNEMQCIDLTFEKNGDKRTIKKLNTIQLKHFLKYEYFEGDIYDSISNEKYLVKLADSGNVYLIVS
jgi:hypothetical protein